MSIKTNSPIVGRLALYNLSADITLTSADTGKVFLLDATGEAIIVPSAALDNKGVWYRFVCNAKISSSNWTITSGSGDMHITIRSGGAAEGNTLTSGSADTAVTFVSGAADEGDFIEMYSTGSVWMVTGACHATANITAA